MISEETRKKMSESAKNRKSSLETRKKISLSLKKYYATDEGRNRSHSEEVRKKISDSTRGKKMSEEAKKKISKARKGQKWSQETRNKMKKILSSSKRKELNKKIQQKYLTQPEIIKKAALARTGLTRTEDFIKEYSRGQSNPCAKLTDSQVMYIRKNATKYSNSSLAEKFSVTRATISLVINKNTWKHL